MSETSVNQTDIYKTLQEILSLFNIEYSQFGNGTVTSYLFEKPTSDIEII